MRTIFSTPDEVQPHYQKKRFSTFNSDLHRFADWLHASNCLDICMESTGKYWVPVFNILEERNVHVTIANPKRVKAVKGNKDDTKDSKWIGDLFRLGLVPSSFIPLKDIRIPSRVYTISLQIGFNEKPFSKCLYCLQRSFRFRRLGYVRQIRNCNYGLPHSVRYLRSGSMNPPVRKSPFALHMQEFISNLR